MEEAFFQAGTFLQAMQEEAEAKGRELDSITKKYAMRMDIGSPT